MKDEQNFDVTWWQAALWVVGGLFLAALFVPRLLPDDRLVVRMVRALVAGGMLFGISGALAAVAIGAMRGERRRALLSVVGFVGGFAGNALLTWNVARAYDAELLARVAEVRAGAGYVELQIGDALATWISREKTGHYRHARPFDPIPATAVSIAVALEDRRYFERPSVIDPRAILRATFAILRGRLEGTSGLAAQLAGRLLGIDTRRGSVSSRTIRKLQKMLAGDRLDDLITRREIAQMYLQTATFGNVGGHEVIGLPEAARVYYGLDLAALPLEYQAELIGRLPNPIVLSPIRRASETDEQWHRRRDRLQRNFAAVLKRVAAVGMRHDASAIPLPEIAHADALNRLVVPRLASTFDEIASLAAASDTTVRVETSFRPNAQSLLVATTGQAEAEMSARLARDGHAGDRVVIDATIIDEAGGIIAEIGMATVPGGSASIEKPTVFAAAIESGVVPSIHSSLNGMSALTALAVSDNDVAREIARRVGVDTVYRVLMREGGNPTGPYEALVLGAGVTTSPRLVAGRFAKWADWSLGVRLVPSVIRRVTDRRTNVVLYEPLRDRMFTAATARQVQLALVVAATDGTASAFKPLQADGTIFAKTGSAGFLRHGRWIGEGGSYVAGCDTATRLCFAFRVRWASGRPMEVSAGRSAVSAAIRFIAAVRQLRED